MGGRGASWLKNLPKSETGLPNGDINVTEYKDDKPIAEEDKTDLIKELEKNNIVVYNSMLKLKSSVLETQLEAINKNVKTYTKHKHIISKEHPMEVKLARMGGNALACYQKNMDENFSDSKIYYNSGFKEKTLSDIRKISQNNIHIGFWTETDKSNWDKQVTVHEYGHFVQHNVLKKIIDRRHKTEYSKLLEDFNKNKTQQNYNKLVEFRNKLCYNLNTTIYNIAVKNYGKIDENEISRYGKSKDVEFFPEIYANMMLSSKPTKLAKALKLYLKGKR